MRIGLAAVVAAALGAGTVSAAGPAIRPGIGIGQVRLGMTDVQVRAALGKPQAQLSQTAGFGRTRAVFQYDGDATTVVFDGPRGALRVTAVSTTRRRDRTGEGFGVGTPESVLARRLGHTFRCDALKTLPSSEGPFLTADQGWRRCTVAAARGTLTVWFTRIPGALVAQLPFVRASEWRPNARVVEVVVRTTSSSASHFGL